MSNTETKKMSTSNQVLMAIVAFIVLFVGYFYIKSDGTDYSGIKNPLNNNEMVKSNMEDLSKQVAEERIESYEIAKRSGNDIDASVQAGIVAAAFLQAHDEVNYNKWKQIETAHQKAAGM